MYLTQIASWQTLARKMAHELKNSLTPIRLTVEEILARQPESERQFMTQAWLDKRIGRKQRFKIFTVMKMGDTHHKLIRQC